MYNYFNLKPLTDNTLSIIQHLYYLMLGFKNIHIKALKLVSMYEPDHYLNSSIDFSKHKP